MKLNDILEGHANSLSLLRLVAALSVIVSHAFSIPVGPGAVQPLETITPFNLGQHAVNVFFVVSGLTLSQSVANNPSLSRFVIARCLRIVPALLVYGVFFAFALGPFVTTRSLWDYFTDGHTYFYPLEVLWAFNDATPPPGVFETVPLSGTVNEPLWTIRYELAAYAGLAFLVWTGLFRRAGGLLLAGAATVGYYVLIVNYPGIGGSSEGFANIARLAFCFMLGVSGYALRRHIVLSPLLIVLCIPVLLYINDTAFSKVSYFIFTAYVVFTAGSISFGPVSAWAQKTDISYGTYIYGWPIQQTLMVAFPGMSIAGNLAGALILAPAAGLASWRLVEERAFRLKRRLAG